MCHIYHKLPWIGCVREIRSGDSCSKVIARWNVNENIITSARTCVVINGLTTIMIEEFLSLPNLPEVAYKAIEYSWKRPVTK